MPGPGESIDALQNMMARQLQSGSKLDVLRVIRAGGLDGGPEIAAALIALEKELTVAQNHAKFMQNLANKLSAMLDVVEASRQEPEA